MRVPITLRPAGWPETPGRGRWGSDTIEVVRHVYECPVRWADLDLLGHVNNAVYVDYLQEARVDMLRTHAPDPGSGDLATATAEGLVVVRHTVDFLTPLLYRVGTVSIECWVTEVKAATFTMAYEIFDEDAEGQRTVYLRASTVLTPFVFAQGRPRRLSAAEREVASRFLEPAEQPVVEWFPSRHAEAHHYPLHVRFSDLDVYGHVNNVKYVEYFQEARIVQMERWVRELSAGGATGIERPGVVVASTVVDYVGPLHYRPEPYDVWTWPVAVGRRSLTLQAEVTDQGETLSRARVVLVFIDAGTQRSTEPPAVLADLLRTLSEA